LLSSSPRTAQRVLVEHLRERPTADQLRALMRRLLGGVEGSVVRFGRFCELARVDGGEEADVGAGGPRGARYAAWLQKERQGAGDDMLAPTELERRVKTLLKQRVGKAGTAVHARRAFAFFDQVTTLLAPPGHRFATKHANKHSISPPAPLLLSAAATATAAAALPCSGR
jgi:hypothetical protein